MTAFDVLFAYDAAIFLVLGLLAGAVLIATGPVTRERVVDRLLASFLLFSGTIRFLLLFIHDAFFPDLAGSSADVADQADQATRLAFAELGIAVLALFGLVAPVAVRIAVVVPLAVVQLGTGVAWAIAALGTSDGAGWPDIDTVAAVVAGLFGLLLMALDWANRSDEPDPLTPDGQRFTY